VEKDHGVAAEEEGVEREPRFLCTEIVCLFRKIAVRRRR
jgi:hypothetical protein